MTKPAPRGLVSVPCWGRAAVGAGLCLALGSGVAAPALAGEDPSQARIKQRIQAVQDSLGLVESRKDSLQGALGEIERRSGEIAKYLRALDRDIAQQREQLVQVRQQKDKLLTSLREHNRGLDGQVRAAYMTGRQEWLRLFLNPDDPARISRVLTYYGYLNRNRLAQLRAINEGLAEVERMEQAIQAETQRLEQLQAQERETQEKLRDARAVREETLGKLSMELRDKNARLQELNGNLHRLNRLVASVELALADVPRQPRREATAKPDSPAPERPGGTQWPVAGQVLKPFGASRVGGRWDGVLIKANEGAPVSAAAEGRVIFADWLRGYGLLLIVEHGGGYMSLYAFNQSLYKAVGEHVAAGEVIATVGRSGGRDQPALYFGVRQAGHPVDPLSWLQSRG